MIRIRLTVEQELRAARVGVARQENALLHHWEPRHRGGSLWAGHIEGACAELAGSLATGLPWTGEKLWTEPPAIRQPDLGEKTEVRWADPRGKPYLNIDADRDDPERFYLLVQGYAPVFDVLGYIKGRDARRPEWLVEYPERRVFRVPPEALAPVEPRRAA